MTASAIPGKRSLSLPASHNIYDEEGEVVCTKRVYNDRLLTFLLRNLKPERYGHDVRARAEPPPTPADLVTVEACLREMEPALPAPPEELLGADKLDAEVHLAEVCDGVLPHFLHEQRPQKSPERLKAEALAERYLRGEVHAERMSADPSLNFSREEMKDLCHFLDPTGSATRSGKRFR